MPNNLIHYVLRPAIVLILMLGLQFLQSHVAQAGEQDGFQTTTSTRFRSNAPPNVDALIGWSQLIRRQDEIALTLDSAGLSSGVYTVWLNIINYPGTAHQSWSYVHVAGQVVQADGRLKIRTTLPRNQSNPSQANIYSGPGLLDPDGAHIIVIIRDHGPVAADPALHKAQLSTLNGGCALADVIDSQSYICQNVQSAAHIIFGQTKPTDGVNKQTRLLHLIPSFQE